MAYSKSRRSKAFCTINCKGGGWGKGGEGRKRKLAKDKIGIRSTFNFRNRLNSSHHGCRGKNESLNGKERANANRGQISCTKESKGGLRGRSTGGESELSLPLGRGGRIRFTKEARR